MRPLTLACLLAAALFCPAVVSAQELTADLNGTVVHLHASSPMPQLAVECASLCLSAQPNDPGDESGGSKLSLLTAGAPAFNLDQRLNVGACAHAVPSTSVRRLPISRGPPALLAS